MYRVTLQGFLVIFIAIVMLAAPIVTMLPDDDGDPGSTGNAGSRGADEVGPMADTALPRFHNLTRSPRFPGPTQDVDVTAYISDESAPVNVSIRYKYDDNNWTNLSNTQTDGFVTYNDRNPSSGYAYGTTLSKEYDDDGLISDIYVYCYTSDNRNLRVYVDGWDPLTSSWKSIYYASSTTSGTKVDMDILPDGFTKWRINLYDTDMDDDFYYNCTYTVIPKVKVTIPATSQADKVSVQYNATDAVGNYRVFTHQYTIDKITPRIMNMTKFSDVFRGPKSIYISVNVTDNKAVDRVYLNWSNDGITWHLDPMTYVSGDLYPLHFRTYIPLPSTNFTVLYKVLAYDVGNNTVSSQLQNLTWNPPPVVSNINYSPHYVNNKQPVTVSATISDADGLARVWVEYYASGIALTQVDATNVSDLYTAVIPAISPSTSTYLRFRLYANDTDGGQYKTKEYYVPVDNTPPSLITAWIDKTYVGPRDSVTVDAQITDANEPLDVTLQYGFDAATWSDEPAPENEFVDGPKTVRSPATGYYSGYTVYAGWYYRPTAGLTVPVLDYLNVYTYASGNSLIYMYVRAYKGSSWQYIVNPGNYADGTRVNGNYMDKEFDRFYIYMYPRNRPNSNFYLQVTYTFGLDTYQGVIPPTGPTHSKVYYRFVSTDLANNTGISKVFSYDVDIKGPTIKDNSIPTDVWSGTKRLQIFANLTDNRNLVSAHLNWSLDNVTWWRVPMVKLSGDQVSGEFMGALPYPRPARNTTYYVRVEGYDLGGTLGQTPINTFQWNPPPWIDDMTYAPEHVDTKTSMNITVRVRDNDGVSEVYFEYLDGGATWKRVNATKGTGDYWSATVPAISNTDWVKYIVYALDIEGHKNRTTKLEYYIDDQLPTFHTPYTMPAYANASIDIWLLANITDISGIKNVTVYYREPSETFSTKAFEQASHMDSLTVAGWLRINNAGYFNGLDRLGPKIGTWNTAASGMDGLPPQTFWTSADVLILDGAGSSFAYYEAITAAQNGAFIITNANTFNTARSILGNPVYTIYSSEGNTTYGMTVGRGAIVYTYDIYNRNYLGYSYDRYSDYTLDHIAAHLKDVQHRFVPYGALIPKTGTSSMVEFKFHVTDLVGLTSMSGLLYYTTDGVLPIIGSVNGPPDPPLIWVNQTHPLSVTIIDDIYISGAAVEYTYDNGTTWNTYYLSRLNGNDISATWTGDLPAPHFNCFVRYHYIVWDRAHNYARYPVGSEYTYRCTDQPHFGNVVATPFIVNAMGTVTISTIIFDTNGVATADVAYRLASSPTETVVSMVRGAGDSWSVTINSPGVTGSVYYHLSATDGLGLPVNSTDHYFFVDADGPFYTDAGWDPVYTNATKTVTISTIADDHFNNMTVWMDWKYGESGAINSSFMGLRGRTVYTDRNPAIGTTTSILSKYYYAPAGSKIGRVTVRVYADDHSGLNFSLRAYSPSTDWRDIYNSSNTDDGIKVDQDLSLTRYDRFHIYYYDVSRSAFYYNVTWSTVDLDFSRQVPGPGYTTWVYYRMRGTDHFGYSTTGTWYRYWADGVKPTLYAHKSPSVKDVTANVNIEATFSDESRIESAQIFYTYEGSPFTKVNMTMGFHNGSHMGASAVIPKTAIPMNVTYFFKFFDAAGNNNTSPLYGYSTIMQNLVEGTFYDFDSSVIKADAGLLKWEWDMDYNGTFNSVRTGRTVRYRYHDNGTYTVMLRMTDKEWDVTYLSFSVFVEDLTPKADFYNVGTVAEGTTVSLDASVSQSSPDEIVSYEWDVDYDGLTFNTAATGVVYNHTFDSDGRFTIALRVVDDDGSIDLISKVLIVTDAVPGLKITYLLTVDEGVTMTFNATETVSYPDGLARIEWDLDYDGIFVSDITGLVVNHTYMDDGVYRFAARAFDDDGSMTELVRTVTVNDIAPVAIINAAGSVDEGTSYDLNGNASTSFPDDLVSHEWDFHFDGTFDVEATGVTANFIYMDNNMYTVALRVWDDDGSATIATMDVTVLDLEPVAEIIAATIVDEGTLVEITSTVTSFPDELGNVEWDLYYDGTTFTRDALGDEVEHTYMDHGIYTIAIRVTDDDGSVAIETVDIEVRDLMPLANATVIGDLVEGNVLYIDGRPSSSYPDMIVSWEWDLHYDGETFHTEKTGDVVEHTYNDHATYTIALRVTDDDGSEDLIERTFTITDAGPVATITVAVLFHSEGSLVTFSAGSSISYPDELVTYYWDWEGDGVVDESTQEVNGRHTFTKPGMYEVVLIVEDDDGTTDTTSVVITVTDVGPTARLEAVAAPEGEPALLDASGTVEPGSDFVAFRWDLDGDMVWDVEDTCSTLEWTWYEPGLYEINMEVEDEDGSTSSNDVTLIIQDVAPVADAGGPYEVEEGTPITLTGAGSHEPGDDFASFRWDLDGDGGYDIEGMEVERTFTLAGEYIITLLVKDVDGSTDVATTTLTVIDRDPEFDIGLPSNVTETVTAHFTLEDLYDPGTETFIVTWYFGDGTSAKGVTVEHTYLEQGGYSGRVLVGDDDGTVVTMTWPTALNVANSPPVVELSRTVLKATEDSEFSISVFGQDTANDTVTYDFDGPGGKIDPQTGVFKWTPLDEHVGSNKFTFIALDEDGGEGTMEVEIDVEDVDNDFLGQPFAVGMGLILAIVLVIIVAILVVVRMRKKAEQDIIEAEEKVDLKAEVEVDMEEMAVDKTETAPKRAGGPLAATKPPRPPPKQRPPGAPPPRQRPPGQRPPPKQRPPGAPPLKKRPPGQRPPPKKRPPSG